MLENIRIVLVGTTHPGNIGAAARAMKTMGLRRLYLVDSQGFPSAEATAMASGADDVLARATVCDSLDEAIGDCHLVLGASARRRTLEWSQLSPEEAAARLLEEAGEREVAVLFGRERYGLTNDELKRCQHLVVIPADPEYSSLNLAQAVQVVTYELTRVHRNRAFVRDPGSREPVTDEVMESFYGHLEAMLYDIGFLKEQPGKLMLRLRRLFNRARPDATEINILRGILSDVQKAAKSAGSKSLAKTRRRKENQR